MINETDIEAMQPQMPHEKVAEFIAAFNGSLDPRLWVKLIDEELEEFMAEKYGTPDHLKELCDLLYVSTGLALTAPDHIGMLLRDSERDVILKQQATVSRTLGSGLEYYGEDVFIEAFSRVHDSNMSKLDNEGQPVLREDGKVIKGPNYKKPDLTDLTGRAA
jgi:hypothetical protein|tara:strand:- start:214 stop:699 length:486 start_codon:yes stop_codon:yes gene_type:complete